MCHDASFKQGCNQWVLCNSVEQLVSVLGPGQFRMLLIGLCQGIMNCLLYGFNNGTAWVLLRCVLWHFFSQLSFTFGPVISKWKLTHVISHFLSVNFISRYMYHPAL